MRAAAILGMGCSARDLPLFQKNLDATWRIGMPASADEADAIVLLGGDGTVHRHLPQLVGLQLPLLVVPHGSGNDLARALKLNRVKDALHAWHRFVSGENNVRRIDLGVITPTTSPSLPAGPGTPGSQRHYFCCVGGVGLAAEVARRANQLPRAMRRRGGYLLSLLPALLGFEPLAVKLQTLRELSLGQFDTPYEGRAMEIAFANAPTYGGGIRIAPDAQLDDGRLEVCVVRAMPKTRLLRLFPSVYSGSHVRLREVRCFQAERLRIETGRPADVYADGEYVCPAPVDVALQRAALTVIVP